MKENNFFELFDNIDSKFIHEAGKRSFEENTAETVIPQFVSGSVHKRKIYPSVLKTAACLAAVGIAAGGFIALGHGTPNMLSPNSPGQIIPEASDTSDKLYTTEPAADPTDVSNISGAASFNEVYEAEDPTLKEYPVPESEDYDEDQKRMLAVKEWNSREFASPIGELPLPKGYSANVDWDKPGFKSTFIPVNIDGAEVRAVADGEIVYIGYIDVNSSFSTGGNVVLIKHNDYVYTNYCEIAECEELNELKVGDKVTAGQVIGHIDELTVYNITQDSTHTDGKEIEFEELRGVYGFIFELRTVPSGENDVGKIMGTVIGSETFAKNEVEGENVEKGILNGNGTDLTIIWSTKNGECREIIEDPKTVTEAELIRDPIESDLKV